MRDIGRDMTNYLPRYYEGGYIVGNIVGQEASEMTSLNASAYDVLAQFYVETATWSLERWERICGIPVDPTKPDSQRRSVILSKLRGVGTVTVGLIKSVAESFANGDVDVTEDNADYTITITFVSTTGVPDNLNDAQASLRDIVPAHLTINFVFSYRTWTRQDALGLTWAGVDALGDTWEEYERVT